MVVICRSIYTSLEVFVILKTLDFFHNRSIVRRIFSSGLSPRGKPFP